MICSAFFALVGRKIVENDVVGQLKGRRELGFDIGIKDQAVHWPVDDPGRGQSSAAQSGDKGFVFPMAKGHQSFEPLPARRASTQAPHIRLRPVRHATASPRWNASLQMAVMRETSWNWPC